LIVARKGTVIFFVNRLQNQTNYVVAVVGFTVTKDVPQINL